MKKNQANKISEYLKIFNSLDIDKYTIEEEKTEKYLEGFHQWADGKLHIGSFLIRDNDSKIAYWFVLNLWNPDFGYYLIIFPENKKGPLLEIQKNENKVLLWKYKPTKQDGKNIERKEYFTKYFGSVNIQISVPFNTEHILDFLNEIFKLTEIRIKADSLSIETPSERDGFVEGKRIERKHYSRERNSKLIDKVKSDFKEKNGSLYCEVCSFNFEKVYGERGKDYIEAHHTRPLSELDNGGEKTKPEEIVLVCANCHKIIHRIRPWLSIEKIKNILK